MSVFNGFYLRFCILIFGTVPWDTTKSHCPTVPATRRRFHTAHRYAVFGVFIVSPYPHRLLDMTKA